MDSASYHKLCDEIIARVEVGIARATEAEKAIQFSESLVRREIHLTRIQLDIKLNKLETRTQFELGQAVEQETKRIHETVRQLTNIIASIKSERIPIPAAELELVSQEAEQLVESINRKKVKFVENSDIDKALARLTNFGQSFITTVLSGIIIKADFARAKNNAVKHETTSHNENNRKTNDSRYDSHTDTAGTVSGTPNSESKILTGSKLENNALNYAVDPFSVLRSLMHDSKNRSNSFEASMAKSDTGYSLTRGRSGSVTSTQTNGNRKPRSRSLGYGTDNRSMNGDADNRSLNGDADNRSLRGHPANRDLDGGTDNKSMRDGPDIRHQSGKDFSINVDKSTDNKSVCRRSRSRDDDTRSRSQSDDIESRSLCGGTTDNISLSDGNRIRNIDGISESGSICDSLNSRTLGGGTECRSLRGGPGSRTLSGVNVSRNVGYDPDNRSVDNGTDNRSVSYVSDSRNLGKDRRSRIMCDSTDNRSMCGSSVSRNVDNDPENRSVVRGRRSRSQGGVSPSRDYTRKSEHTRTIDRVDKANKEWFGVDEQTHEALFVQNHRSRSASPKAARKIGQSNMSRSSILDSRHRGQESVSSDTKTSRDKDKQGQNDNKYTLIDDVHISENDAHAGNYSQAPDALNERYVAKRMDSSDEIADFKSLETFRIVGKDTGRNSVAADSLARDASKSKLLIKHKHERPMSRIDVSDFDFNVTGPGALGASKQVQLYTECESSIDDTQITSNTGENYDVQRKNILKLKRFRNRSINGPITPSRTNTSVSQLLSSENRTPLLTNTMKHQNDTNQLDACETDVVDDETQKENELFNDVSANDKHSSDEIVKGGSANDKPTSRELAATSEEPDQGFVSHYCTIRRRRKLKQPNEDNEDETEPGSSGEISGEELWTTNYRSAQNKSKLPSFREMLYNNS